MEDKISITVQLNLETYGKILKIVQYENLKNEVRGKNRHLDNEVQDFISGCVNKYLNYIEEFQKISGYDDLGKPFRLKNRFKELMIKRRWKQKELADMTGIDPGNISPILNNHNQASLDYFLRLWVAFGCPPLTEVLYREE